MTRLVRGELPREPSRKSLANGIRGPPPVFGHDERPDRSRPEAHAKPDERSKGAEAEENHDEIWLPEVPRDKAPEPKAG